MNIEKFISFKDQDRFTKLSQKFWNEFKYDYTKNAFELINNLLTKEEQKFCAKSIFPITLTKSMKNCIEYDNKINDFDKGIEVDTIVFDKNSLNNIPYAGWHSHYELNLILNGFDVKHVHRDIYNEVGDDGGFIVVVASKNGYWYVFVSNISSVMDVRGTEEIYSKFNSYEESIKFVHDFAKELCLLIADTNEELYRDEDFEYLEEEYDLKILTKENHDNLSSILWSISAFIENIFESTVSLMNIDQCDHYNSTPDFRIYGKNRFDDYLIDSIKLIELKCL